ncbi:hypothetical protein V6N13_129055 [Hibiscus sabdariffa]
MARLCLALLIVVFVLFYQAPLMQSRKLIVISQKDNLVPSDFPQEPPTEKDHVMADNERVFAAHLAKLDRILQSVPSPGGGH